jgi:hypothetical protein
LAIASVISSFDGRQPDDHASDLASAHFKEQKLQHLFLPYDISSSDVLINDEHTGQAIGMTGSSFLGFIM